MQGEGRLAPVRVPHLRIWYLDEYNQAASFVVALHRPTHTSGHATSVGNQGPEMTPTGCIALAHSGCRLLYGVTHVLASHLHGYHLPAWLLNLAA